MPNATDPTDPHQQLNWFRRQLRSWADASKDIHTIVAAVRAILRALLMAFGIVLMFYDYASGGDLTTLLREIVLSLL